MPVFRVAPIAAALAAAALAVAPARALEPVDTSCGLRVGSCAIDCDPCAGGCNLVAPVQRWLGLHALLTGSLWGSGVGAGFVLGVAHSNRVGAELAGGPVESRGPGNLRGHLSGSLRVRLWSDGLDGDWPDGGDPPDLAFVVSARAGAGFVERSGPDVEGLVAGVTAEVLLWRWLVVALRPATYVDVFRAEGAPLVAPHFELGVGLAPGVWGRREPVRRPLVRY